MENDKTDIIWILQNNDIKEKTLEQIYYKLINEIEQPIEEQLAEIEDLKRRNK